MFLNAVDVKSAVMDADKTTARKRALDDQPVSAADHQRLVDEMRLMQSKLGEKDATINQMSGMLKEMKAELRTWKLKLSDYERRQAKYAADNDAYLEADGYLSSDESTLVDSDESRDEFCDDLERMDECEASAPTALVTCAPPAQKACSTPAQADVTCAPPAQKTSTKPVLVEGPGT